jgi:hypothetical protein
MKKKSNEWRMNGAQERSESSLNPVTDLSTYYLSDVERQVAYSPVRH